MLLGLNCSSKIKELRKQNTQMVSDTTIHAILYGVGFVVISTWLCAWYYVHTRREPVSLDMQAWVGDTRKEGETAIYRNLSAPPSGNLINGLELNVKNKSYKYRKGNFGDLWQCSLDLAKTSQPFVQFEDNDNYENTKKLTLQDFDLLAVKFVKYFQNYNTKDNLRIGISCPVYKYNGFLQAVGCFMTAIQLDNYEVELLDAVPRAKSKVDILFIDSFATLDKMNNSEAWYKSIIVSESLDKNSTEKPLATNVISWDRILNIDTKTHFEYDAGENYEKDDNKIFFHYKNMAFNQLNLVSSVASFITTFPHDHPLTNNDVLQVLVHENSSQNTAKEKEFHTTQFFYKVLTVLMHGGSLISTTSNRFKLQPSTTILSLCAEPFSKQLNRLGHEISLWQKLKLIWAMNFISENIFVGFGCVLGRNFKLRVIFLENNVKDYEKCADYVGATALQKYSFVKRKTMSTEELAEYRSLLGARVVMETFAPLNLMGPAFVSHFYDYRILPRAVDKKYQFCGVITPCLESKLVECENMDITKRQGMVCIRGFNIGKPTGPAYEEALKLSETFDKNREGWMPLLGVYGVFGVDQCFYEM